MLRNSIGNENSKGRINQETAEIKDKNDINRYLLNTPNLSYKSIFFKYLSPHRYKNNTFKIQKLKM